MAECPSSQEDEEDVWEDSRETFESPENTFQLNPRATERENKKPEVTAQGETWNETDQSKRSNGTNSLDNGSQPESHEIRSTECETETGDHNPNGHVPAESEQKRDDAVQPGIPSYTLPKTEPNTVKKYNYRHFLLPLSRSAIVNSYIGNNSDH